MDFEDELQLEDEEYVLRGNPRNRSRLSRHQHREDVWVHRLLYATAWGLAGIVVLLAIAALAQGG